MADGGWWECEAARVGLLRNCWLSPEPRNRTISSERRSRLSRSKKFRTSSGAGGPCPITLFRLGLVHLVLARVGRGETIAQAVTRVAATPHPDHRGTIRYVSERTLRRWIAAYKKDGVDGLCPTPREKATGPVALDEELVAFLASEKRSDLRASVPECIRRARVAGLLGPEQPISRSTVNRTLKRMGISLARRRRAADRDSRSFEYPHRLDMVLCDGKHFRAGASRAKRVALNFLDDATRKYLVVVVGTAESTLLFLRGLELLIRRYGRPSAMYLDKGPGFISLDTQEVFRRLDDIPLIHGETAYPEGHGKVERFNQTLLEDVLRVLTGDPEVDPDCEALTLRLDHYRTRLYNPRGHEGLKGESPAARFLRDSKPLDLRPTAWIEERFGVFEEKLVSAHHLVKFAPEEYEVPTGLAGSWVTIERRVLEDNRLLLNHDGRLIELHPVDRVANAHSKRSKRPKPEEIESLPRPRTAASRALARDLGSLLDEDGGFSVPDHEDTHDHDDTGDAGEET